MHMKVFHIYHGCSTVLLYSLADVRPMFNTGVTKGLVYLTGDEIHSRQNLKNLKPGRVVIQHMGTLYDLKEFASVLTIVTTNQVSARDFLTEVGFKEVARRKATKTGNTIITMEMSAAELAAWFAKKAEERLAIVEALK